MQMFLKNQNGIWIRLQNHLELSQGCRLVATSIQSSYFNCIEFLRILEFYFWDSFVQIITKNTKTFNMCPNLIIF